MSYQTVGGPGSGMSVQHKYKLNIGTDMGYVNELRTAINNIFQEAKNVLRKAPENMDTIKNRISFSNMLKARHEELKYSKTDKEKFDIVHSAINSLGQFATTALEKNLIMFHEVVVY